MLTDLPCCLPRMRCLVFVYICFYRQVRVYYDHAKYLCIICCYFRSKVILILIKKRKNAKARLVIYFKPFNLNLKIKMSDSP